MLALIWEKDLMLNFITSRADEILRTLDTLRERTSILLHHDCITGTSSTTNLNDYWDMITKIQKDIWTMEKDIDQSLMLGTNLTKISHL